MTAGCVTTWRRVSDKVTRPAYQDDTGGCRHRIGQISRPEDEALTRYGFFAGSASVPASVPASTLASALASASTLIGGRSSYFGPPSAHRLRNRLPTFPS